MDIIYSLSYNLNAIKNMKYKINAIIAWVIIPLPIMISKCWTLESGG